MVVADYSTIVHRAETDTNDQLGGGCYYKYSGEYILQTQTAVVVFQINGTPRITIRSMAVNFGHNMTCFS